MRNYLYCSNFSTPIVRYSTRNFFWRCSTYCCCCFVGFFYQIWTEYICIDMYETGLKIAHLSWLLVAVGVAVGSRCQRFVFQRVVKTRATICLVSVCGQRHSTAQTHFRVHSCCCHFDVLIKFRNDVRISSVLFLFWHCLTEAIDTLVLDISWSFQYSSLLLQLSALKARDPFMYNQWQCTVLGN